MFIKVKCVNGINPIIINTDTIMEIFRVASGRDEGNYQILFNAYNHSITVPPEEAKKVFNAIGVYL